MKNPWQILSKEVAYSNPWIEVQHHEVLNPSGNKGIYGVVSFKNSAIAIVPIDAEGNTYLVGQYRFPLNAYSWEVPEGGCLIGSEEPLEAAKRELKEETGFEAAKFTQISTLHTSNSVCDEYGFIFLAEELTFTGEEPEDTEDLKVMKLPFAEAVNMVMQDKITDSLSVAAILKVARILGK